MVKCPSCGHTNRKDVDLCQECGAALARVSPPRRGKRKRQGDKLDTRPVPKADVIFAPVPEGASLDGGRYGVVEVLAVAERRNVYLAEDSAWVRLCPKCWTETFDLPERFCPSCGAEISSIEPLHPRYLIQESADEQAYAAEARLMEMNLEHPGLLLPCAIFTEAPYGSPRYYRVEPEFAPVLATSRTVPQALSQVLEWGVSLARALDYLHQHRIALRRVGLEHIAVAGRKAYWANLNVAYVIPPTAPETAAGDFAQDVRGLAATLLYLATGQREITEGPLPERIAAILSEALTAPTRLTADAFATALESVLQELWCPAILNLVVGRRTDVGQERALNEDSLLTLDMAPIFRSSGVPVGLYAVADGMGGHEAGDVASRLAIQTVAGQMASQVLPLTIAGEPLPNTHHWLMAAMQAANQSVYDQRKAAGTDMGTTLVAAFVVSNKATIANVGDSRAYLLKQNEITQLTTDHSLVERLVAVGQITPEEAINHPQRNIIYRVIGEKPEVEVDLYERVLAPSEALLLCSDGLSGMVPDQQIWQIWRTSTSPQVACDRLVTAASQAGGEDNITVVIVQVEN